MRKHGQRELKDDHGGRPDLGCRRDGWRHAGLPTRSATAKPGCPGALAASGTRMNDRFALILFLVLVLGGGLLIGWLTAPGEWYAGLVKPAFNPPGWLFGPVWTVLYVMIAIAGWRAWRMDVGSLPMRLWWAQLALNFLWSPIFFSAHQIGLALVVVLLLLATIVAFIVMCWRQDRVAAWLFLPYAAWVAFASVLNAAILALN
jgi:tryptophan-rich sensory protein